MSNAQQSETSLILIVDDDEMTRELTETILRRGKFRSHGVGLGSAALELLRASDSPRPSAVLVDIRLPDTYGTDVCAHIKRDPALAQLPVILISALDTDSIRASAAEAGADAFLSKLQLVRELVPMLHRLMNHAQS